MLTPALEAQLSRLNPSQHAAVMDQGRPLLVLAGAGTGKTSVITTRIAWLMHHHHIPLERIMAVTFTNKAAQTLKDRLATLTGSPVPFQAWVGTFHNLGAKLLRRHGQSMGIPSHASILNDDEQLSLLKATMPACGLDPQRIPPRLALYVILGWKEKGWRFCDVPESPPPSTGSDALYAPCRQLYGVYEQELRRLGGLDFADLILLSWHLLRENEDLRTHYHEWWQHILIDEYQDVNALQYQWFRQLIGPQTTVCCVGDDDQAIYGWRGANVDHILNFPKDFPQAHVVRLETNYRSTSTILKAASGLISHNKQRYQKTLEAASLLDNGRKPALIQLKSFMDDRLEATGISTLIRRMHQQDHKDWSHMAILVRAGFQTRLFEEFFLVQGVPYTVVGALRFYDRREVRDAVSYVRAVVYPEDSLSFERVLTTPKRGIGENTLVLLKDFARKNSVSLRSAAEKLWPALKGTARQGLRLVLDQLQGWRQMIDHCAPSTFLENVLTESGYHATLESKKTPETEARLENIRELVRAVEGFNTVGQFLEHVNFITDQGLQENESKRSSGVQIMTLHMAKGLEFDTVFLPGWEEGLFPHGKSMDEKGTLGIEEERRLAYVGLTRAQHQVVISWARSRRFPAGWQKLRPSRFLSELPRVCWEGDSPTPRESSLFLGESHRESGSSWTRQNDSFDDETFGPSWIPGQKVSHQKFGRGVVEKVEEFGLLIRFEGDTEPKTLHPSFVKATF